jgi:(1->4)-alpha-D-glucan 1-alpha-D-glucosylmutase
MSKFAAGGRIPRATYRLQLNHQFTFRDAQRIVAYLARLGVSHVYVSPILKARPGSMHGYDVTDHSVLNPELGTREEFDKLIATLHEHRLGLIVDIVPNHLGVMGDDNVWWLDVLENGPASQYASHFDIDWQPNRAAMRNRILVPILGEAYGNVLERGELRLAFDAASGSFNVHYYQHRLPVDPREYPRIFAGQEAALASRLVDDETNLADFESLLDAFAHLPARHVELAEARARRTRDKEVHKRRLLRLIERCPRLAEHITSTLEIVNGVAGEPSTFDKLDALLDAQAYRLAYWRVAVDEINYRRFFDVNDLAALRMNEPLVFERAHALIFELTDAGQIDGLRIDHPDGLYDPQIYFEQLQQRYRTNENPKPLYVVAEKILAAHEHLPEQWAVHGTTGYDFAGLVNNWLVDNANEVALTKLYKEYTGKAAAFDEVAYQSKKLVMRASLAAEVSVLATQLDRIAQQDRHTADFTRTALRDAIIEVIACFPVYRTYISPRGGSEIDSKIIHWAISLARKRGLAADVSVFDFLRDVLLAEVAPGRSEEQQRAVLEFAMKFQQVTSPVTAKGVEDTSFYLYNRLVSLNEVGGEPRRFGISTGGLHQANLERAKHWPHSMLATSTHDTKRSEDVRARIAVISELPELWRRHLGRWTRLNRSKRRQLEDGWAPRRNEEYLLYQTLVGTWTADQDPAMFVERIQAYVVKAAREAKAATSWLNPNTEYEQAISEFVAQLFQNPESNAFLRDLTNFNQTITWFGQLNAIVQTVLKLTSPGMPDIYQGTELPNLSLVDPDNRRAVDYDAASALLSQLSADGRADYERHPKLFVTWALLQLRKREEGLFTYGGYEPLRVTGEHAEHVCAFARVHEHRHCIVVVPRHAAKLLKGVGTLPIGEVWGDTQIDLETLRLQALSDVFSGRELMTQSESLGSLRVAEVLSGFPVAVLVET